MDPSFAIDKTQGTGVKRKQVHVQPQKYTALAYCFLLMLHSLTLAKEKQY